MPIIPSGPVLGQGLWRPVRGSALLFLVLATAAAGLGLRWLVIQAVQVDLGELPLLLAVSAAAWRGGAPLGLLATAYSAVGDLAVFQPTELVAPSSSVAIRLVAFVVVASAVSALSEVRLRALRNAEASREAERLARSEAERALERLRGLEDLLERLAPATTSDQVADTILAHAVPAVGADAGAIVILSPDRDHAHVVWAARPDAARSSEVVVHESPVLAEVLLLGRELWDGTPDGALPPVTWAPTALVPLRGRGPVIGALAVRWSGPHALDATERGFIEAVASQCGQALERSLMFEAERHLRRDTEASREDAVRLRDELRAVLQSIGEPILVVSPTGDVALANRAAELMLGDVAHIDDLSARLQPLGHDSLDLGPGRTAEACLDGTDRIVTVSVFGIRGRPSGSRVLAIRDVTELRRSEAARDVFIGVLSHELRTPVTTILGGVDLLGRDLPEADRRAVMEDVAAESERLRRLVEDVLVLSRFERDALEVEDEPVLVHHIIASVAAEEARRTDPSTDVRLDLAVDLPPVRADATYLEQILRNLIGNGVKYGGADGPVVVRAERHGERLAVLVQDAGPGFPEDDAERLFDLFYRSSRTSSKPGAGIGLFVARQLARSMGGDLSARPRPGRGAEFVLSLRAFVAPDEISGHPLASEPERIGASPDAAVL